MPHQNYLETFPRITKIFNEIGATRASDPQHFEYRKQRAEHKRSLMLAMFEQVVREHSFHFLRQYQRLKLQPQITTCEELFDNVAILFDHLNPPFTASDKKVAFKIEPWEYVSARMMLEENKEFNEVWDESMYYLMAHRMDQHNLKRKVSLGIELELEERHYMNPYTASGRAAMLAYAQAIDALQEIGVVITPEAFRELSLPPSLRGERDTARAVYELERMGLIEPKVDHNCHVTVGGFESPILFVEDFLLTHFAFYLSNFFGRAIFPHKPEEIVMVDSARKGLFKSKMVSNYADFALIDPIKITPSGEVEFRAVVKQWQNSWSFARGAATLGHIMEGLVAFTQINSSSISEVDPLATLWLEFKTELYQLLSTYCPAKSVSNLQDFLILINEHSQHIYDIKYRFDQEIKTALEDESMAIREERKLYIRALFDEFKQDQRVIDFLKNLAEESSQAEVFLNCLLGSDQPVAELDDDNPELPYILISRTVRFILKEQGQYIEETFPKVWAELAWAAQKNKKLRHEMTTLLTRTRSNIKRHLETLPDPAIEIRNQLAVTHETNDEDDTYG